MNALHLPGSRCPECATYSFPHYQGRCINPLCARDREVEGVELSREGYLWSFTRVAWPRGVRRPAGLAEIYTVVVIRLPKERLLIMGLTADDVNPDGLEVGQPMQLVRSLCLQHESPAICIGAWLPVTWPQDETSCKERLGGHLHNKVCGLS